MSELTTAATEAPPPGAPRPAAECRQCGGDSKVVRTTETDGPIVRRRMCVACGWRWNTREISD